MGRDGQAADWDSFNLSLGRYVTAAGNAEEMMFRVWVALCARAGRPKPTKAPMWAGLVDKLLEEVRGTTHESDMTTLLAGAKRRGRLRNNIIHAGWYSAGADGYVARRHPSSGEGSFMLFLDREALEQNVAGMETFEEELEHIAQSIALGR